MASEYFKPSSPDLEIRKTDDGSHTLYSRFFNSTFHSMSGAIQESEFVFINSGLKFLLHQTPFKNIAILEIGLGTGLNAFLTYLFARENSIKVHYEAVENYPIELSLARELNYPEVLNQLINRDAFLSLHRQSPGVINEIHPNFNFVWEKSPFETFSYPEGIYDLVFFDPFDAKVHNAVWEKEFLSDLVSSLKKGGVLITYGAKGSFKRALRALDMHVEALPGPPGKREITRAIK